MAHVNAVWGYLLCVGIALIGVLLAILLTRNPETRPTPTVPVTTPDNRLLFDTFTVEGTGTTDLLGHVPDIGEAWTLLPVVSPTPQTLVIQNGQGWCEGTSIPNPTIGANETPYIYSGNGVLRSIEKIVIPSGQPPLSIVACGMALVDGAGAGFAVQITMPTNTNEFTMSIINVLNHNGSSVVDTSAATPFTRFDEELIITVEVDTVAGLVAASFDGVTVSGTPTAPCPTTGTYVLSTGLVGGGAGILVSEVSLEPL